MENRMSFFHFLIVKTLIFTLRLLTSLSSRFQFYYFIRGWLHFLSSLANPEAITSLLILNVGDHNCTCATPLRAKIRQVSNSPRKASKTMLHTRFSQWDHWNCLDCSPALRGQGKSRASGKASEKAPGSPSITSWDVSSPTLLPVSSVGRLHRTQGRQVPKP